VLLILLAVGLFAAEVKVASYGLLTVGGAIAMILGAMMLVDAPIPEMRVPLSAILPAAAVIALWATAVVRMVLRAQSARVTTGAEGMVGEEGSVDRALTPEGWVIVHGERWRAVSETPVSAGERIVVTAVSGLLLRVRRRG
jgi:membrane-bound serine protease (ClpP class)